LFFALVNHWLIFDLLKNNQKYPLVKQNHLLPFCLILQATLVALNEWAKIQGRYEVLSLVETVTQSLHIMGQVFQNELSQTQLKPIQIKIKKQNHLLPFCLILQATLVALNHLNN
jgi:endogenous inhibitor of DNA gyrase (YacG/DUF329 family)